MRIILKKEESLNYFYNALCNGLSMLSGYGLKLEYSGKEYAASRKKMSVACYEDVLIQMLKDGYKLTIVDVEGEGENTKSIGIKDVYTRVAKTPFNHLSDMINEDDVASTADAIIQTVFFEDLVFG